MSEAVEARRPQIPAGGGAGTASCPSAWAETEAGKADNTKGNVKASPRGRRMQCMITQTPVEVVLF